MLKNITRKGVWLGAAALIAMTASPAAATHDATAEADSSAVSGTGIFDGLLDTGVCQYIDTSSSNKGKETEGPCGANLDSNQVDAFTQVASASGGHSTPQPKDTDPKPAVSGNKPGDSAAVADVAGPIDLTDPAFALDLSDLALALSTNTIQNVVGDVVGPLGQLLVSLQTVTNTVDGILKPVLDGLQGTIPLKLIVRGVTAQCSATPTAATGNGGVAGVDLSITLPGQDPIVVPLDLKTDPNSPLLITAPKQLVDGIIYGADPDVPNDGGLQQTLNQSLGGALSALDALLTGAITKQILDPLLTALEPTLLTQLNDLLKPLVTGTVNKQVTGNGGREIEVTALQVILLGNNELNLARVHCGPNTAGHNHNGGTAEFQVLKTEKVKGKSKVEWTVKVRNPKSADAHDVVVKDFYPKAVKGDVKLVSKSTGDFDEKTGVWKIPTLGGKKVATLVFEAKVSKKKLDNGFKNVACAVTRSGALKSVDGDKPSKIQKNDTFEDDTDGCDTSGSQKDKKKKHHGGDTPKSIDSGVSNGGNLGALAATGLLAMAALGGTATRQRLLLNR